MEATEVEIVLTCEEMLAALWWRERIATDCINSHLQGLEDSWFIHSIWHNAKDGTVKLTLRKKAETLAEANL